MSLSPPALTPLSTLSESPGLGVALGSPLTLPIPSRCVSASASMTQQLLLSSPAPRPRPFRVCNCDRSLRKGIMAHSLAELLHQVSRPSICQGPIYVMGHLLTATLLQVQSTLLVPDPITLVLDEDGTVVETEAFFCTLEEGTVLMALGKGQSWSACKVSVGCRSPFHPTGVNEDDAG